jgi:hypothetical protein
MTSQSVSPDIQPIDVYPSDLEGWLERVGQALPVVKRTLEQYGDLTVEEYLATQNQFSEVSFQPREDVAEVLYEHTQGLLGEEVARRTADEFLANPVVLTANHHGVDYFAQSVQGTLLFSWRNINGKPATTIPVLACANVPLDNLTYPRGLILYPRVNGVEKPITPIRIPLFPDKIKREIVSCVRGINAQGVDNAKKRIRKLECSETYKTFVIDWLDRFYSLSEHLENTYAEQSVVINHQIWRLLNSHVSSKADLVYVELEKASTSLILRDIDNPKSLFSLLAFNQSCREKLIATLDEKKNCWSFETLLSRIENEEVSKSPFSASGTFLFWGIDQKNRRIPLCLVDEGGLKLKGRDDSGVLFSLPFTEDTLRFSLENQTIIPSVFTCLLVLLFARGVTGLGGYYQADYLLTMEEGILQSISADERLRDTLDPLKNVNTAGYLSGIQMVFNVESDQVAPLGVIEMAEKKSLNDLSISQLKTLTIKDAHIASLVDTVCDAIPDVLKKPDVMDHLNQLISEWFKDKSFSSRMVR